MIGKLALAGLGLIGLAKALGARKQPKERLCLISMTTGVVKSVHGSLTAAENADAKTPIASHFIQDCEPGWKKGTRVPGARAYGRKWSMFRD